MGLIVQLENGKRELFPYYHDDDDGGLFKLHIIAYKMNYNVFTINKLIVIIIITSSGLFDATQDNLKISICPQHRELDGIRWRCNKKKCSTPVDWAPHKSKKLKGDRGLTSLQS